MDGIDLPAPMLELVLAGRTAPNVSLIIGATSEDCAACRGGKFGTKVPPTRCLGGPGRCSEHEFEVHLSKAKAAYFPELNVSEAEPIYNNEIPYLNPRFGTKWYWASFLIGSDAAQICPARRMATMISTASGVASYRYMFSYGEAKSGGNGAFHAYDVGYIFYSQGLRASFKANELSAAMVFYWRNFASTGDPNRDADGGATTTHLPHWPLHAYDENGTDASMVFGGQGPTVVSGVSKSACDFWDDQMWKEGSHVEHLAI
jgi:hypothetical protein